jgi:adenine-specific DNA-methyltransferase
VARPTAKKVEREEEQIETPSRFAWQLFTDYCATASMDERRGFGQFFTPPEVASFMADMALPLRGDIRVLEPGAGTAILAGSLCERLPGRCTSVHIDVHEIHPKLAELCESVLRHTRDWLSSRGVSCTFEVHRGDFVLEKSAYLTPSLFNEAHELYDVAIANPPYFKLLKDDPRARAASHIVHGQPNIYAIFMAIMASLVRDNGVLVTITPRSFTTGDYFRRFREVLFSTMVPEMLHLFGSRKDAFRKDEVLQENVIMRLAKKRTDADTRVTISSSAGISDLVQRTIRTVPLRDVIDMDSRELAVHIPVNDVDNHVLDFVRSWPATLQSLGLKVSTGPVVAFRAWDFIHDAANGANEVPLLWLQHVRKMDVRWPIETSNKRQYISDCPESQYLLLPNQTYVVMRRFSAKEEHRRIVSAPIFAREFPGRMIGLENHLNYIHRPKGILHDDEARGLAALLNSVIVDRYFRISSGNTQVSAVELRQLPIPDSNSLHAIGKEVRRSERKELDVLVAEALHVPTSLMKELERESDGETR